MDSWLQSVESGHGGPQATIVPFHHDACGQRSGPMGLADPQSGRISAGSLYGWSTLLR